MTSAAALQPPAPPRCPAFFEQCQAVTRQDASRLLADQPPGSYIIRPVAPSPGSDYTVAYTYVSSQQGDARLQHVRVRYDPRAQLFYHEDVARASVPQLINSVLEQPREVRVPNRLLNGRSRVVQHLPPRPQRDAPIPAPRATSAGNGGAVSAAPTMQATRLAANASSLPSVSGSMLAPPPRPPPRRPPPRAPTANRAPPPPESLPPLPTPPVGTQYERFISPDDDEEEDAS